LASLTLCSCRQIATNWRRSEPRVQPCSREKD
jgi:hypothetical protein